MNMIRSGASRAVLALTLGLVAAPIPTISVTHVSDSQACVAHADWTRVHRGMLQGRVHHILGTSGYGHAVAGRAGTLHEFRWYPLCNGNRGYIDYLNRRVFDKFWNA